MADLVASIKLGDLDLTSYPYAWEFGGDLGKPELVTEALEQQLQDGEIVSATRSSNREIELSILVEAADLAGQADAESALALECAKARNTLTYNPGNGAAATVFDTFVAELAFDRDDDMELNGLRRWKLTIPALPFPRSDTLVTTAIPAPVTTVTATTVDDASSLTGWSVNTGWSLVLSSGAIFPNNTGAVRTNLVTNPSFEVDTAGWAALDTNVATISRSTAQAYVGAASLAITKAATTANSSVSVNMPVANRMSVTAGQSYAAQVRVRSPLVAPYVHLHLFFYDGSGNQIGDANALGVSVAQNAWSLVSAVGVAPAGAVKAGLAITIGGTGNIATGVVNYIDAAMVEQSTTVGSYFDGSTADDSEWDYWWSGTAHASTSGVSSNVARVLRSGLAASTTGKPYLRIRYGTGTFTPTVMVNGAAATVVASTYDTVWVDVSGLATVDSVQFSYTAGPYSYRPVDDLSLTNATRYPSTGRETSRIATVLGSARTQASLAVADTTPASLGSVLLYTCPVVDGMAQPPLRDYLQAGPAITADTTTMSGSRSPLVTTHTFDLPAASVPEGGYLLLARIRNTVTGTYALSWAGKSRMGTTDDTGQSGSTSVALTANTWAIVTVAALNLPTREMGSDGKVRITLSAPANTELDEAWLFNVDLGRLTWVEAGTGTPASGGPASRLWVDAASLDNPEPSITLGTTASRSDELGAGEKIVSFGVHEFTPPQVNVFIATSGSTAAAVTLTHYPRWHTHVGTAA